MTKQEIAELLVLKGWSRNNLARKLNVNENTVQRWFMASKDGVKGPAAVLMLEWLAKAREEVRQPV